VPRIKGSHNAILSGIEAAEAAFAGIAAGRAHDRLDAYEKAVRGGPIARDLRRVRNVKPLWSRFGNMGIPLAGLEMWLNTVLPGVGLGYTLRHGKPDYATLRKARNAGPIEYPKPDGVLTFDKLTNLSFSGTNHEEDQPVHLLLADATIPIAVNLPEYAEPAQRYCPANVYEVVADAEGRPRFQINAQNCVHCKTCDIKDPSQNITWVPPEGGGGPNYSGM
jgi:electron-transferring-flavoprotein dehydrogenase